MTWNTKRHPGEPRIFPPRRIAPLGNDGPISNRVASRFPRVISCTQRAQPAENPRALLERNYLPNAPQEKPLEQPRGTKYLGRA